MNMITSVLINTKISILILFIEMIVKINPKKLWRYLWHKGPFIYFYREDSIEDNLHIVKNIKLMAEKYPDLKVLEINWQEQIRINHCTSLKVLNQVHLYYNNELILRKQNPNRNEIEEIFDRAIECYNNNIDILAQKINFKINSDLLNNEHLHLNICTNKKVYLGKLKSKGKNILKNKIVPYRNIFSQDKSAKFNESINKNPKIDHKFQDKTINSFYKNISTHNKVEKSIKPWFYDVKIDALPSKIFLEESDEYSIAKNEYIYNDNDVISPFYTNKPKFESFNNSILNSEKNKYLNKKSKNTEYFSTKPNIVKTKIINHFKKNYTSPNKSININSITNQHIYKFDTKYIPHLTDHNYF